MALGDLFGGRRPQRRGPGAFESELIRHADSLEPRRGALSNAVNLYFDSLASGRAGARREALGSVSADVSQRFAAPTTNVNRALSNAITRGRGLSRVLRATSGEFDSQLLRDRIAAVQNARARQARGASVLAQAAGIQEGVNAAIAGRRESDRGVRQNVLGTAVGVGAGILANRGELFPGRQAAADSGITYDPTAFDPSVTRGLA